MRDTAFVELAEITAGTSKGTVVASPVATGLVAAVPGVTKLDVVALPALAGLAGSEESGGSNDDGVELHFECCKVLKGKEIE